MNGTTLHHQMSRTFDIILGTTVLVGSIAVCGWALFFLLKRSYDPAKILFKCAFTIPFVFICIKFGVALGPYGPFLIVLMGVVLSFMWTPHIGEWIASPLASLYDGGSEPPEPKPLYSIAYSKRKLNKPLEAIVEIRKQLAKFPNDFEGVTLLANIQAEDLKDLPSAEITFNHFCDLENAPPKQVAAAFTQLADWHLKFFHDADSARAALEKIIERFPDTELSLQTAQRIAHLGGTERQLRAAQERRSVFVPEGVKSAGLRETMSDLVPEEIDSTKLASDFVKHLELHPDDTEAREKLAIIYARHYKRLDLAALELEHLIEQPEQPVKRVAHWLNLLADLQVHGGADYETIRSTLEKIIEKFSDLPVAELARNRLGLLKLEIKGKQETSNVKLGVYEQNIGLKSNRTY